MNIEEFDAALLRYWNEDLKLSITGKPWPQAKLMVIVGFDYWLCTQDWNWVGPYTVDTLVTCDDMNNPPSLKAENKLAVRVQVSFGAKYWKWELETD
jgi:hypothetical protein